MPPPFLSALDIHKAFGPMAVLRGIDLHVAAGETVCLLGPSGCGKTTLLRIIAGLERPDRGQLFCAGAEITHTPPHRRDFGLMFQEYVLFPHMTVAANIAFGLEMHGWDAPRRAARVRDLLEMTDLAGFEARRVYELSGGQQQRVALARSLAPQPRLLMLDEPLGSLDRVLRDQLLTDLRQWLQHLGQTALYVTHDQQEAFAIADRVALMNAGQVEQEATPVALYRRPATPFAARFLGFKNLLPARVAATAPLTLHTEIAELQPQDQTLPRPQAADVMALIRPEAARPASAAAPATNRLRLPVQFCSFRGSHWLVRLAAPTADLAFEIPGPLPPLAPGDFLTLDIDPAGIVVL